MPKGWSGAGRLLQVTGPDHWCVCGHVCIVHGVRGVGAEGDGARVAGAGAGETSEREEAQHEGDETQRLV
eukprot:5397442-Prymnesium_polylepis.1